MKLHNIYFLLLSIFVLNIHAQKKFEPTSDEISLAKELKSKYHEDDQVALVNSNEVIHFDLNKKEGKVVVNQKINETLINLDDRADIQKFYFYDGQSNVNTFNIFFKNKKKAYFKTIDKAYTSEGLFHNDTKVKFMNIDFPLKGYQYKTNVEIKTDDIKYFTSIYFHDIHPTEKRKIEIFVPKWLEIEFKEINFNGFDISKKETVEDDLKKITYTLNNIPARYKDKSAPGPSFVYPHLLVLAKSYTINGVKKPLFNKTQDLYNWYKSLVNELKNETSSFEDKVIELTKDAKNEDEKIKNIYYWIQDNIRYIAFEDGIAGFKPDEAENVFNKRYGDCKGMANLTKQMLVKAGFDARLVWIGTKRIAYDYSTPNLSVDNHMICAIMRDGKPVFLDATEKYNAYGEFAYRIQDKQTLIENEDTFIIKTVPSSLATSNNHKTIYNFKLEDDLLKGTTSKTYSGESRATMLYYMNNTKNDKKIEYLKKYLNDGQSNLLVSNISTSNIENRESDLTIDYDLTVKNAVTEFDGEMYINIDFDKEFSNFIFKDRNLDYVFNSKKQIESTTNLSIPTTHKVITLPSNISISNNDFDLSVTFKEHNNIIIYKKLFTFKNAVIKKESFNEWNAFVKELIKTYNEQIILNKK